MAGLVGLLLWFSRRFAGVHGERFYPFKFLLKSVYEVMGPILEKDDEAERKKREQDKPKKTAKQCHGVEGNLLSCKGQRGWEKEHSPDHHQQLKGQSYD